MMNVALMYLVLLVLRSYCVDIPDSPCPRLFDYFHSVVWMGRLTVPVPRDGFPVFTQVFLTLKAALRSRYVGLIELDDPVEIAVDKILNLGAPVINYTIRFPLPYPIPALAMIKVNNVTICCCGDAHYGLITNILLEHRFPTNAYYFSKQSLISQISIPENVCGHKKPTELYQNLKISGFGEWPWLVAILLIDPDGLEFHCTGNLLTEKHVITAAHCVKTRFGRQYAPRNFVVYLGKYDLTRWDEKNSQIRDVENIIIHPDYLIKFYTADLAIMVLSDRVELNDFVHPVCIWQGGPDLYPLIGRYGAVVGWGKDPNRDVFNAEPRMFFLPLVDQEECLRSRRDYFYITSGKTFCAGLRNGTGPCNGDSGSGLVLPELSVDNQTVWYLRGIVSLSLLDPFKQTCDLSNYLVFTDVAKFTEWISETIETTY